MQRVKALLQSSAYQDHLRKINEWESQRAFCKHDFSHFLEVARLSWIFLLQEGEDYKRDVVYAAAFVHDIARWKEYKGEGCHALLSAELAEPLLTMCGFSSHEKGIILNAVKEHRQQEMEVFSSSLSRILRKADKHSRLCYKCNVREKCRKFNEMPQKHQLIY